MPAPATSSLERLAASSAALEAPAVRRRMLVIVNPYATTVSDRLKTLVTYALRGRYEVDVVDTRGPGHATELSRGGRPRRATTPSRRSAATAPSTRPPTAWRAPTRR